MINIDAVKQIFLRRIGDIEKAHNTYFDISHREFVPEEYIEAALDDCRAYFGTDEMPRVLTASTVADIAYARYNLDISGKATEYGLKSYSYSEGTVSKSETYSTRQELLGEIESILKPYSRYRVVTGYAKAE